MNARESAETLRAKALQVHRILCRAYDAPFRYFSSKDPLSELVSALLSHRTRNAASKQSYDALRAKFPDWASVRDAPPEQVREAISACTWPEQKAPRIQQVLREIGARRGGELSLDFLATLAPDEAQRWLQELPGVGPKSSAAVLLFSRLRLPALPVDGHHHRVAQRLGLIGERIAVGPAHAALRALLPADWGARELYDHHEALMIHGQRRCHPRRPDCKTCPIAALCVYLAKGDHPDRSESRCPTPSGPPRRA